MMEQNKNAAAKDKWSWRITSRTLNKQKAAGGKWSMGSSRLSGINSNNLYAQQLNCQEINNFMSIKTCKKPCSKLEIYFNCSNAFCNNGAIYLLSLTL